MRVRARLRPRFGVVTAAIVSCVVTAAMAACYVCDEMSCTYLDGGPCSAPSTVKICESPPREAVGQERGFTQLTADSRIAGCWTIVTTLSSNWYQGPCSAGPPAVGTWYPLESCGLSGGQCCWTSVNYVANGIYSDAGYEIKDCGTSLCPIPYPG